MPVLIVAHNCREATTVARRYELRPNDWRYLSSETQLRGTRGAQVIWACSPDDWRVSIAVRASLRTSEARTAYVGCPYRR